MADPTEAILRALKAGPFAVRGATPGDGLPAAFPFKPPGTAQKWAQAPEVPEWQQAPLADGAGKGGKTVLNINGKRVSVSDNFLSMTPEEQNLAVDEIAGSMGMGSAATTSGGYSEAQLKEAARKALAAGDTAAAKRLVDAARKVGAASGAPASKMLRFEIQTPDGKTYEVEAPDQDAALAAVKSMEGTATATGYRAKADAQTAAIEAAQARRNAGSEPSAETFTPQQQAAIEAARGRRSGAPDASVGGMPFSVTPPTGPEPTSPGLIPGGMGALLTGGAAYATGPGALALPATSFATRKIAEALSRRAGQNVRDNVGRSDANRGLIEALMGRANPLASGVPATGLLASLLGRQ